MNLQQQQQQQQSRLVAVLAWALALAVLAGVFTLYTRPAFMVTLIDQLWACF